MYVYYFIINKIKHKTWKKVFPQYDVSGKWEGELVFTKNIGETDKGWKKLYEIKAATPVIIEQTCETIKILTAGSDDLSWHSILADWDDRNNLDILYEVQYNLAMQQKGFPESRVGREHMYIEYDGAKPHRMRGKFWHCIADDGKPIYIGEIVYERPEEVTKPEAKSVEKLTHHADSKSCMGKNVPPKTYPKKKKRKR